MAAFFVTGSGTDIGKTFICAGLLAHWRARGLAPAAFKPVVSGFDMADAEGSDPAVLLRALGRPVTQDQLKTITLERFKAPLSPDQAAALEGRAISLAPLVATCRKMAERPGPVLIEGAGGVMTPLNVETTMLDLAVALGLPVVFVAGSYLGALSHALTGLAAIEGRGLKLAAVIVNESAEGSVGLGQTCISLKGRTKAPIVAVPRDAPSKVWTELSAALL